MRMPWQMAGRSSRASLEINVLPHRHRAVAPPPERTRPSPPPLFHGGELPRSPRSSAFASSMADTPASSRAVVSGTPDAGGAAAAAGAGAAAGATTVKRPEGGLLNLGGPGW